jgi:hypothetical protein
MPRAVRITFGYAGLGDPRVISTLFLQKKVLPSARPDPSADRSGFWFDVVDQSGIVLYRRVTGDPRFDIDAPANDEGRFTSAAPPAADVFSVVLPTLPGAARLQIWSSNGSGERAKAILSIPFPQEP